MKKEKKDLIFALVLMLISIVGYFSGKYMTGFNFDSIFFDFLNHLHLITLGYIALSFFIVPLFCLTILPKNVLSSNIFKKIDDNWFILILPFLSLMIGVIVSVGFYEINYVNKNLFVKKEGVEAYSVYKKVEKYPENSIGNLKSMPIKTEEILLAKINCKENGFKNLKSCEEEIVKNLKEGNTAFLDSLKKDQDIVRK